jgi:hypothetical protein
MTAADRLSPAMKAALLEAIRCVHCSGRRLQLETPTVTVNALGHRGLIRSMTPGADCAANANHLTKKGEEVRYILCLNERAMASATTLAKTTGSVSSTVVYQRRNANGVWTTLAEATYDNTGDGPK